MPCGFSFNHRGKSGFSPFISIHSLHAATSGKFAMTTLSNLTSRELGILQFVLAGHTNKSIASEMCISEKTVEFHLDNIYTKVGVRTRVMAGLWALQQGILAGTREIPS
jgi:DNA-binding NarL/FixJ family response regulator